MPRWTLAAAACVALAVACGGSGGSTAAPIPAPSPTPAPSPAPITYVALGDSAGFGIGALPGDGGYPPRLARRLREAGRQVELVNLSIPGATAHDLARLPIAEIAGYHPTLVTVCVGGNDVSTSRTPQEFGADLDAILANLATLRAAVVVCNVPDVSLTPSHAGDAAAAQRVVALNAEVARAAAAHGDPVADIYAVTRERLPQDPSLISPDGFHPSAAGYELWAEAMFPVVKRALGMP